MWSRTMPAKATAGFTIIEALVALALVAIVLAAMAPLIASSNRGIRSVAEHIALVSTARAVESGLPDRSLLVPGTLSGEIGGDRWRVDILPFAVDAADTTPSGRWIPQTIVITIRSPFGATLRLNTVRLRRSRSDE